jgi:hypothetical protein
MEYNFCSWFIIVKQYIHSWVREFSSEIPKERDTSKDVGVDGRIILKWISGTGGWLLRKR